MVKFEFQKHSKILFIAREAQDTDLVGLPFLPYVNEIEEVRSRSDSVTGKGMEALYRLPNLQRLCLNNKAFDDDFLAALSGLINLTVLRLNTSVKGPGLKHLQGLTRLKEFHLSSGWHSVESGLEHLAGLSDLREVSLVHAKFTPDGFVGLGSLSQVETLDLSSTSCRDVGALANISMMVGLRNIDLHNSKLVPAILPHLTPLTGLTRLGLTLTKMGDEDVAHLSSLVNLTTLELPDLGSHALLALEPLTRLENLYVDRFGSFTEEVETRLKAAAPKLEIGLRTEP